MQELLQCRRCPRLAAYRDQQKETYPQYHCLPVEGFGVPVPRLLIVGLAPGLHGANATGRPFTGDTSGDQLFRALHKFHFASQATSSSSNDSMELFECGITNAVKCVPPQNRPRGDEITNCNSYLRVEIARLKPGAVILALGGIAHRSVLKAFGLAQSSAAFGHLGEFALPGEKTLLDSYHCSRYNLNTGRLTQAMFEKVFHRARLLLR
jgi:uracil-DNA glycosylase family 4